MEQSESNTSTDIDGISIDDLLPPVSRNKRKEPTPLLSPIDALKKGMETPLSKDNKGYKMLVAMGFKADETFQEPLKVEIRPERSGLGKFELEQEELRESELLDELRESKRKKTAEEEKLKFQARLSLEDTKRRIQQNLFKMLQVAYNLTVNQISDHTQDALDLEKIEELDPPPILSDPNILDSMKTREGTELIKSMLSSLSIPIKEKHSKQLEQYLREDFKYCYWCSRTFDTEEQMKEECPGIGEDAHTQK